MLRLTLSESIAALRWSLRETGAHLGCSHEQVRLMMKPGESVSKWAVRIMEMERAARAILQIQADLKSGDCRYLARWQLFEEWIEGNELEPAARKVLRERVSKD